MKIGFIGLGIMGAPMCENIIKKHDDTVYCYNRSPEKTKPLIQAGGVAAKNSLELAVQSDLIITMVPRSEDVKAVGEEILPALAAGKIWVDMSTIDPDVSVELAQKVKAAGASFLDAPVVKSRPAAVAGKLGIYVGGPKEEFEKVLPVLRYMGEHVIHLGDNGAGLVMKVCHNALVSQIQNGVNETITLARANGISPLVFAQAVSYGGAQNFYLDGKKEVIEKEDFTTAFSVENMAKDVQTCLRLADKSGIAMPGEENVQRVYDRAIAAGYGKADFSATVKAVEDHHPWEGA